MFYRGRSSVEPSKILISPYFLYFFCIISIYCKPPTAELWGTTENSIQHRSRLKLLPQTGDNSIFYYKVWQMFRVQTIY